MPKDSPSRSRMIRMQIVLAVFSLGLAILAFGIRGDLFNFFNVDPRFLIAVIGTLALQGVVILLMLYLRGDIRFSMLENLTATVGFADEPSGQRAVERATEAIRAETRHQLEAIYKEVGSLQARIASAQTGSGGTPLDTEALLESLRDHVTQSLAAEVEARVERRIKQDVYAIRTQQTLDGASLRLRQEISSLTRRGNVNLLIGVATTAIAVGLLVYMVLTASGPFDSWPILLSHYIPRVSTVVFIEVFSFFFLRLYRGSLGEIKYYQNELTTLDVQRVALDAATALDEAKARISVIEALGKSDRNRGSREISEATAGKKEMAEMVDLLEKAAKIAGSAFKKEASAKGGEG